MICPRWLVQSSAIGVVGVALVTMPLWMNTAPAEDENELIVRQTSFQHVERADDEPTSVRTLRQAQQDTQTAHHEAEEQAKVVRVYRVRYHLVDAHQGPQCPAHVEIHSPESLDEVRTLIEQSQQETLQRYRYDYE